MIQTLALNSAITCMLDLVLLSIVSLQKDGCCILSLMSLFQTEIITSREGGKVPVSETEKFAIKPKLNFIGWHYEKSPPLIVQKGYNFSWVYNRPSPHKIGIPLGK